MRGLGYLGIEQVLGAAQPPHGGHDFPGRVGDQDIEHRGNSGSVRRTTLA